MTYEQLLVMSLVVIAASACDGTSSSDTSGSTAGSTVTSSERGSSSTVITPGGTIPIGTRALFDIYAHCGVKLLGDLNGRWWITDETGSDAPDWLPAEWAPDPDAPYGSLTAELVLADGGSSITATFRGRSVVYRPADGDPESLGLLCD